MKLHCQIIALNLPSLVRNKFQTTSRKRLYKLQIQCNILTRVNSISSYVFLASKNSLCARNLQLKVNIIKKNGESVLTGLVDKIGHKET